MIRIWLRHSIPLCFLRTFLWHLDTMYVCSLLSFSPTFFRPCVIRRRHTESLRSDQRAFTPGMPFWCVESLGKKSDAALREGMSIVSSTLSHQSLARSLLARKWGIQCDDDTCTVIQPVEESVPYNFMGQLLCRDTERFNDYVRQIVTLEMADLKQQPPMREAAVDELSFARVTENFPPPIAEMMLPVVRKKLKRLTVLTSSSPPSPLPEEPTEPIEPPAYKADENKTPEEQTSPQSSFARLIPYDDAGEPDPDNMTVCSSDTIIGRKHLRRDAEVLSAISRKWLRLSKKNSQVVLSKIENTCPLWYSLDDDLTRHPLKTRLVVNAERVYIYHDRNDTALGHIQII